MEKSIDEDIEIVKNHIKELDEEKILYGGFLSRKQAIENVLKELETQINNTHILQSQLDIANAEKIEWKSVV